MRKLLIAFVAISLIAACNNDKKDPRDDRRADREKDDYRADDEDTKDNNDNKETTGKWSSSDISEFNRECEKTLEGKGLSSVQMSGICDCLRDKFDDKYENYDVFNRNGTAEEGRTAGEECSKSVLKTTTNTEDNTGNWTSSDKRRWMDICNQSVINNNSPMNATQRDRYCNCVLEKLEGRYANFDKMNTQGTEQEGEELGGICLRELGYTQ